MTRSSLANADEHRARGIQRRSVLKRGGIAIGLIGAQLAGLFPEIGMANAEERTKGALRGRELFGDEATRTHRLAEAHPEGRLLRAYLATHGFANVSRAPAVGVEDDSGREVGRSVATTWSDGLRRSARLVQHQRGGQQKSALAVWDDGSPATLTVYGERHGSVAKVGTITSSVSTVTVVDEFGGRHVLALPARSGASKMKTSSLASVSHDPLCQICQTVTAVVCGLACELVFFVICTVILVLDVPAAFVCFLVSFGVCYVTCSAVQSVVCSALC